MKKIIVVCCLLFCFGVISKAQDVVNNYQNWTGKNVDSDFGNPFYLYTNSLFVGPVNYEGEFLITAEQLPWADPDRFNGSLANIDISDLFLSYDIALVSFPFSMDNAFDGGCADGSSIRILDVPPDNIYNSNEKRWDYQISIPTNAYSLYNKIDNYSLNRIYDSFGDVRYVFNNQLFPLSIVSTAYLRTGFNISRMVIPHSVFKITIKLHCGPSSFDQVLDKFYFYIDLTRGMMRTYPFTSSNSTSTSSTSQYDVMVRPIIVSNPITGSSYEDLPFCQYYKDEPTYSCSGSIDIKGDIADMHPFQPSNDDFCQLLVNANADVRNLSDVSFGEGPGPYNVEHLSIPTRSMIISTGVRDATGQQPAGYVVGAGGNLQPQIGAPVVHQYTINHDIDLSNINSDEKVIYNPSEVSITSNLTFPSNYTFKTISGTYPFLPDLLQQATDPLNGGPYNTSDPYASNYIATLPYQTDLYIDYNTIGNYPTQDHRYSSIYHLEDNSKLTIEPCVSLYDLVFDVKPNSELYFENWYTNLKNVNRYKIEYNGGIVRKAAAQWLFQNDVETDRVLSWDSESFIKAGRYVDPGSGYGNFSLESGSRTLYKASEYISLEQGFEAKLGSEFDGKIENVDLPACALAPPQRIKGGMIASDDDPGNLSSFEITPNPTMENPYLVLDLKERSYVDVRLMDNLGRVLSFEKSNVPLTAGKYQYRIDMGSCRQGVYYINVLLDGTMLSRKVVKIGDY